MSNHLCCGDLALRKIVLKRNAPSAFLHSLAQKPNMTLPEVLSHLTSNSQWAIEHPNASSRMVQLELIDALASGQLKVLARVRTHFDNLSPLYQVDRTYFNDVLLDVAALRRGADNAIQPSPGGFQEQYVDFRVWRSEVERVWPTAAPARQGKLGRKKEGASLAERR